MRALRLSLMFSFLFGCGQFNESFRLVVPQPLGDALVYLDEANSSLVILDPAGGAGETGRRKLHRIDGGEAPSAAIAVPRADQPGSTQVLVLDPGGKQILVLRDKAGTVETLSTGVPFEALDVSADGSHAIAFQPEGVAPVDSLVAFPNRVAVLDLATDPPTAETLLLDTGGARPIAAAFSEALRIQRTVVSPAGPTVEVQEIPVAFVFVRGGLIPIDLSRKVAADDVPITDSDRSVVPAEVLFTNNEGDAIEGDIDGIERAFVRTSDGELFVFAVTLTGDQTAPLAVSLENLVTPDATVHDIELFFDEEGKSLLLAAAGNELILVEGYSGVAHRFEAPIFVDRLVRFDDPRSGDALCLGYSQAGQDYQLLRLNPLMLAERRSTGMETISLGKPISNVEVGLDGSRAVLSYYGGRDLGILDLTGDGRVTDMSFYEQPLARALVADGDRMLLVVRSAESESPHLAEVTFGEPLQLRDVPLLQSGAFVGQVGDYLWVDHGTSSGDVSFFPVDALDEESVIAFHGIFLTRLLDEEPPTGGDR